MRITKAPRGILQIDEARIVHRNFEGRGTDFNNPGDRNFSLIIPDQNIADQLIEDGWNVKIKAPREDGDTPFIYLPVKLKYNEYGQGPTAYLQSGRNRRSLDQDTIGILDQIDIVNVDLDIRPYDWEYRGSTGRTAYLRSICVTQEVDRFADTYDEFEE